MARILLFGKLAETAGWRERHLALPADIKTLSALRAYLADSHQEIGAASTRTAVNKRLVHGDDPVSDDDEVAFMPPMSGG